jgi:hypothetical protein
MAKIDIYDVGWLAAIRYARRALTAPELAGHRAEAWWKLRQEWHYTRNAIREGRWRRVRQSFNGWMAEPTPFPDGMKRVGTGWTRRRALRSLRRHGWTGDI